MAATIAAHVFGITAIILMLIWLLHFRGGLDLFSDDYGRIFNVHPFLMLFGYIFFAGEAIMVYKTVWAEHRAQKMVHTALHVIAIALGIVGICAVFKFHKKAGITDMYTLHSWLGIITFCAYGLQWLFGFLSFWRPGAYATTRDRILPVHRVGGVLIFIMAICTAMMGLVEKFFFLQLQVGTEARLINFTGLFIILYGLSVSFSVMFTGIHRAVIY